ncbi:hypothetical protein F2Q70_00035843 [Brassica cretica]|uniref:Uncharacterized protein n=1 Tax=Brassica cretica TaxID=69181 RepID=A0A8S9JUX3_BRACR|nr:hypothetical protein F2Q70_00035843 [Brassica cretica]
MKSVDGDETKQNGRSFPSLLKRFLKPKRRFYPSPDQPVEACQFLYGEVEVVSKTRLVQSTPIKTFILSFDQVFSDQLAAYRQRTLSWNKFCDSDRIVPSPSRSASGPRCWVRRTDRECYNGGGGYGGDKGGNSCRCRSSYADAILSKVHG